MKQPDWNTVLEQLEDNLLLEAMHPQRKSPRRFSAAAAALLCILAISACGAKLFGIRDLHMPLPSGTYVTMAGVQGSPEYLALQEWETRCPRRQQGPAEEDPIHHQYGACSYSAKKILDEILEKYALAPYDQWTAVYDGDPQSLYDAVGLEGFLPESRAQRRGTSDPDLPGCSLRNNGTIYTYSDITSLPDGTLVPYELNNSAKGYMPVFLRFSMDPDTTEQWHYRTTSGTQVLLCLSPSGAFIIADLPGSFLCINTSAPLTRDSLETFANLFRYDLIASLSEGE